MRAGVVRAEGQVVTTVAAADKILIQQKQTNGQFLPREVTYANLITGGGTGFTAGSVVFTDTGGDFAQDNTNFFFNNSTKDLSIGGNIIAKTAGKGLQVKEGSNARMGTATLVAGTVTIANTSVTANTRIFVSRYSAGASTAVGSLSVGTVTANTSFIVKSLNPTDATTQTNDISVVHWMLVEPAA